jgi:hypothetical protein
MPVLQSRVWRNVPCARWELSDVMGQQILLTAHSPTTERGRVLQVLGWGGSRGVVFQSLFKSM